ncbi:MAG: DNA-binding protein [Pseudomonadota bacterium]|nr:DNA-binding protein [Pseudomonadota bacterium]
MVTAASVKAAVEALRAAGEAVTTRAVYEKLGRVGSMGTVHKLLQKNLNEKHETPYSLRQLPSQLQQVIMDFADIQVDGARRQFLEELSGTRREMADLAEDNERLTATVEEMREQLLHVASDKATVEGRVVQLVGELGGAREETAAERRAAEEARMELAKVQLRAEALAPLAGEVREGRAQWEAQRAACARAEQEAAVLEAQKLALGEQVQNLKSELANARAGSETLDMRILGLSELFDRERDARTVAERELAVLTAMRDERQASGEKGRRSKDPLDGKASSDA